MHCFNQTFAVFSSVLSIIGDWWYVLNRCQEQCKFLKLFASISTVNMIIISLFPKTVTKIKQTYLFRYLF